MMRLTGGRMPIYEYECRNCRNDFELLVHPHSTPACPRCDSNALDKRLSAFAVGRPVAADHPGPQACGSCGDPRGAGACTMN